MNPVKNSFPSVVDQLSNNLSPAQSKYLNKVIEVHLAKQMLKKMREKTANPQNTSPQKKRKRRSKNKRSKFRSMQKSYDQCQCLQKLNSLAQEHAYNLQDLLKEKERLVKTNERLKHYTENEKATRQAYFIQQVEKRNLQILYLQEKLRQKRERHDSERKSLEVKLNKKIREKKNLKKNLNI